MSTIFLHGAGVIPDRTRPQDYPLLAMILDLCPELIVPVMPTALDPTPQGWLRGMEDALRPLGPDTIVIGHSLGGSTALQWMAACAPGFRAHSFLGLAMPHWGPQGWNHPDFTVSGGYAEATEGVGRTILAHAADDEVVGPRHLDLYARDLPQANILRLLEGGHALATPALVPILRAILQRAPLPQ